MLQHPLPSKLKLDIDLDFQMRYYAFSLIAHGAAMLKVKKMSVGDVQNHKSEG